MCSSILKFYFHLLKLKIYVFVFCFIIKLKGTKALEKVIMTYIKLFVMPYSFLLIK